MIETQLLPALSLEQIAHSRPSGFSIAVDFKLVPGEKVVLIGASGSGKSTIIDLVAGFEQPQTGKVVFAGRDMTQSTPSARPVTTLFQSDNLFGHLDAFANVALGISPSLRLGESERSLVDGALESVGLGGKRGRLPQQLSGGERQRVAIARILVRKRSVILLDEPFSSLGPALAGEMLDLVETVAAETGAAVLLVTHDLDEALGFGTRALFLDNGRIVHDGPVVSLASDGGEAVQRYLGQARNRPA